LFGFSIDGEVRPGAELEQIPFPDLLNAQLGPGPDPEALTNLLDLAFLGRAAAGELDAELDLMPVGTTRWAREQFSDDLFLAELVQGCLGAKIMGHQIPIHRGFVRRVLCRPPADVETIAFRQSILRELEERPELARAIEELLGRIHGLLARLRASRDDARLEPQRFRFEVLGAFRSAVNHMVERFSGASSGLDRISQAGEAIRASRAFQQVVDLLDHQYSMANLRLQVLIDANGRMRHVEIEGVKERKGNPYYRRPLRRWLDRIRLFSRRYQYDPNELVDMLVQGVYQEIAPALARIVQLVCHLEVLVATRSFADDARSRGLDVCLAEVTPETTIELEELFNPLLLPLMNRPVPSNVRTTLASPVAIVTGPNSGGKTRLLQAVGLAQVLGQNGLYVPCKAARMPLAAGLFASIVEVDRADQSEGRLGTELLRLRSLFDTVPPGSLVLLDELCSGTNPSEAIEIVDVVLRLLGQLKPVAFVTTHFLDYAEQLRRDPGANGLGFLQAEVDEKLGATFRFIEGVASTSLAVGTARRLGVTFDELERRVEQRMSGDSGTSGIDE
jgi:DNA mismatch repair protein MutS2